MTDEEYDYNPQVLRILDTLREAYSKEPHLIRWGQVEDQPDALGFPNFIFRGTTRYGDTCAVMVSKDRLQESEHDVVGLLADIQLEVDSLNRDITALEAERAAKAETDDE